MKIETDPHVGKLPPYPRGRLVEKGFHKKRAKPKKQLVLSTARGCLFMTRLKMNRTIGLDDITQDKKRMQE